VTDIEGTEAYQRGLKAAEDDMALMPEPDDTASVSLDRRPDRSYYKICQLCHWPRASELCKCKEDGDG
jgi:hypothetical protein